MVWQLVWAKLEMDLRVKIPVLKSSTWMQLDRALVATVNLAYQDSCPLRVV